MAKLIILSPGETYVEMKTRLRNIIKRSVKPGKSRLHKVLSKCIAGNTSSCKQSHIIELSCSVDLILFG